MSTDNDDLKRDKPKHPKQQIYFSIDLPPSKNHAYFYRRGAKIPKASTDKYVERTRKQITKEMKKQKWKKDRDHVWYYLDLFFYFPDRRRRDSHNCIEVLMDALETVLFRDDYYIMPRIQTVELDRENPRLEVVMSAKQ